MNKLDIPCKVLDKRIKDGWFGRSYFVTIRLLTLYEEPGSPIDRVSESVQEVRISIGQYYEMNVGKVYGVSFVQGPTGLWAVYRPN
jgi:hypothetical protein